MRETTENEPALPMLEAAATLTGAKDGRGIGQFVDTKTLRAWIEDYRTGGKDTTGLEAAFQYGVEAEARFAGLSFVEAEADIRSEWSSEKGRVPWDGVRDAVWSGFDRARERRV
jgi:hypothetical protein